MIERMADMAADYGEEKAVMIGATIEPSVNLYWWLGFDVDTNAVLVSLPPMILRVSPDRTAVYPEFETFCSKMVIQAVIDLRLFPAKPERKSRPPRTSLDEGYAHWY